MTSANYMQRVFDALRRQPEELLTVVQLSDVTGLDRRCIRTTIRRLQQRQKDLVSVCGSDHVWRYGLRPSAIRPVDNRGKRRISA